MEPQSQQLTFFYFSFVWSELSNIKFKNMDKCSPYSIIYL